MLESDFYIVRNALRRMTIVYLNYSGCSGSRTSRFDPFLHEIAGEVIKNIKEICAHFAEFKKKFHLLFVAPSVSEFKLMKYFES